MKLNIRGSKIEITDAIKSYLEGKVQKLDKYFENPEEINANIVVKTKGIDQTVEITIPIKKAILRNDVNSVNHREAAFIASYFDIIFALNEQLHPGEKRLIQFAKNNCKILPNNFELNLMKLFQQQPLEILETLDIIIAELKSVLKNI